jgi:hypothetical protein
MDIPFFEHIKPEGRYAVFHRITHSASPMPSGMRFILYDINEQCLKEDMPDPTHNDLLDPSQAEQRALLDFDLGELLSNLRPPQHIDVTSTSVRSAHLLGLNHHAVSLIHCSKQ